jgi:hypothetical protein
MSETIDGAAALVIVKDHDNAFILQALIDGQVPGGLLGDRTITASVKYAGAGSPLTLTLASGIVITSSPNWQFKLTLTDAQIDNMPLDGLVSIFLTIWNADNSKWGHGSFAATVSLG